MRAASLRAARELLLAARNAGGKRLDGVWEYLRDELDGESEIARLAGGAR